MTRKVRTTYSVEFKREAVRLLEQGHKETAQNHRVRLPDIHTASS